MRYHFQKILERTDWIGTLELSYTVRPVEPPSYTDRKPAMRPELRDCEWAVIEVHRHGETTCAVVAERMVTAELSLDPEFRKEVRRWCRENWEQRKDGIKPNDDP